LDKLEKEIHMEGLVLDLRNNPGGLLTAAIGVSEQFLEPGKLVVYIKGRDEGKDEYLSKGQRINQEFPMIILVNAGSASASEIVAGALQDWGRAVVLGTRTFGKGSVQTLLPLSDGAGLRLTTARYYTPKGGSIQNTGIEPDIVVDPLPAGKKFQRLREKDLKGHLENEEKETVPEIAPEGEEEPMSPSPDMDFQGETGEKQDIQLQKAIDILKSWKIFKKLGTPTQVTESSEGL
jgi:carboxyl-terminal processing protease